MELTNEEIIAMYELQDTINKNFIDDKNYGFDLDLDSFFLRCRNLKTQIYGLRVQAFLSTRLKYKTTPSSLDCGDFKTRENEDVEFKCSFIDKYAKQINIKQIRQWQDIDYYYVFTVDYTDYHNLIYKCYKLNKKQMQQEMLTMNAQPIHSTKKQNENNERVEYGFSVKLNSEHYIRWEDNYLNKKFDLRKLNEEALEEIKTEKQRIEEREAYKAEIVRLKIGHPEEVERIKVRVKELMDAHKAKLLKTADALLRKRTKAYNKIPQDVLMGHLEKYRNKEITRDYLNALVDYEIRIRYVKRKRKIKEEKKPYNLRDVTQRFYTKKTTYEEFCEEFKATWNYIDSDRFDYDKENEDLQFRYEPTQDEYLERRLKEPSVY